MSRTEFTCYRCRGKVAHIRPGPPRTLKPAPRIETTCTEDGRILLECGECGTVNQFTWRPKVPATVAVVTEATDTLAPQSQP